MLRLPVDWVQHVEAFSHMVAIVADAETIQVKMPISEIEKLLGKKVSHCQKMTEFQGLDEKKKARRMKKIHEKGVSIRQISRLTGISKGDVERLLKAK